MTKKTLPFAAVALLGMLASASPAMAQGRIFSAFQPWDLHPTDVLDAADGDDPYDFDLYAMFDQSFESGTIQREYHCSNDRLLVPSSTSDTGFELLDKAANDGNCDNEPRIVPAREMDYERIRRRLNILARFGIYKDLEFHFFLPIVLFDQTTLKMASQSDKPGSLPLEAHCVSDAGSPTCSQSSVYREDSNGRADDDNSFFRLRQEDGTEGNKSPERASVDNPTLGVWWAPFNDERDDTEATWRLGIDYTLNVVGRVKPTETKVGQGYDELRLSTAFSRRFEVMRPFMELSYSVSNLIEPSSTPFPKYKGGQTLVEPGDRLAVRFGSDIVAWEDPSLGQWFAIDFGGEFVYQFEGRDYTPLYSALGSSECNSREGCSLTKLAGTDPNNNQISLRSDGITDVEQFGALRGWFGLDLQAHKNVRLKVRAVLAHQLAHFLTFADAGKDNGRQDVGKNPTFNRGIIDPDTDEENPVFNQHMDLAGSRFRLASHLDLGFFVAGAVTF